MPFEEYSNANVYVFYRRVRHYLIKHKLWNTASRNFGLELEP